MMHQEISSGVVVVKKSNAIWNVLLIRDMHGILTFPKGMMEQGETAEATAIREAAEETGITGLSVVAPLPDVSYFYTREGTTIHKLVHYFLCTTQHKGVLHGQIEEGISEIIWMPLSDAITNIGYAKSNRPVLEEAMVWVKNHPNNI